MSGNTSAPDPADYIKKGNPKDDVNNGAAPEEEAEPVKFSPEEEAVSTADHTTSPHRSHLYGCSDGIIPLQELLGESNTHKNEANTLFTSGKYDAAISKYDEAVAVCPNYLDFELAVLKSNVSACYLKLQEWKNANTAATAALEKLGKLESQLAEEEKAAADAKAKEEEEIEDEIISPGAEKAGPPIPADEKEDPAQVARDKKREDIKRIRYKALIRRARARSEEGGWTNLAGAEEDYKLLSKMDNVSPGDRKLVQQQLKALPARVNEAKEKETAEMWGKLKDVSET